MKDGYVISQEGREVQLDLFAQENAPLGPEFLVPAKKENCPVGEVATGKDEEQLIDQEF